MAPYQDLLRHCRAATHNFPLTHGLRLRVEIGRNPECLPSATDFGACEAGHSRVALAFVKISGAVRMIVAPARIVECLHDRYARTIGMPARSVCLNDGYV